MQATHAAKPTVDNGRGMKPPVVVALCRDCHRAIERIDTVHAVPSAWRHVKGAASPLPIGKRVR